METRILDGNKLSASRLLMHHHDDGSFQIEEREDAEALIETNRTLRNETVRDQFGGEMHRVASIPMNIYMELVQKGITRDPKAFAAWLNDRDNRAFRTHEALV